MPARTHPQEAGREAGLRRLSPAARAPLALRASLVLTGLAWVLPFLYWKHVPPLPSLHAEAVAFALGLAALAFGLVLGSRPAVELPRVGWVPLVLGALLLLQLGLGMAPYPEQILIALLYLVWAGGCAVLGRSLVQTLGLPRVADALAQALALGGVASVVMALLQYYDAQGIWDDFILDRHAGVFFGNVGQANHFASFTAMALASVVYLQITGRVAARVAVPVAGLLLFGLALSGSRSGWLYLGFFTLLALAARRAADSAQQRALGRWAAGLLPGLAAAQLLAKVPWLIPDLPALTSADRLTAIAVGMAIRIEAWRGAWELFLAQPWLGSGLGGYAHGFYEILARSPGSRAIGEGLFHHAHSLPFQLLAELGVVGGAAVVVGVVGWSLRFLRAARIDASRAWWLSLLAVLGAHSLLEYPLWYAYFLAPAAFLLGGGDPAGRALRAGWTLRGALAGMTALGALTLHNVVTSANKLEFELMLSRSALDAEQGMRQLNESMRNLHRETLLAPYIELMYARSVPLDTERLDEKRFLSAQAKRFLPLPDVAYRHAALLALAGNPEEAMRVLRQAAVVYPAHLPAFLDGIARLPEAQGGALRPLVEWAALEIGTE
ncbi:MAG TPA: Wzy polymerase domain-containing protein [Pelomicrobium sp.]|nr:Wzy polymerase domain-containing protein [Pelomicrobium sp.]